jgi:hypothetical protein
MSQFSEKTIKYFSLLAILACVSFGVAMVLIIYRNEVVTNILFTRYTKTHYLFY